MGLTVLSEDNKVELWSGPYTSFGEFRKELAVVIGLKSYKDGIYGKIWSMKLQEQAVQEVEEKGSGAVAFFLHPDDEGLWTPEECKSIVDLFGGIAIPESFSFPTPRNFRQEVERMIKGLEYCHQQNLKAVFC